MRRPVEHAASTYSSRKRVRSASCNTRTLTRPRKRRTKMLPVEGVMSDESLTTCRISLICASTRRPSSSCFNARALAESFSSFRSRVFRARAVSEISLCRRVACEMRSLNFFTLQR